MIQPESWLLPQQFLKNDMDRIDNPDYFMKNFQCPEIIKFFSYVVSNKQIMQRKNGINLFYDRFISLAELCHNLYIHLKWIVIVHQVIQNFNQNNPLYGYTLKALQIYIENYSKFEKKNQNMPYEKYLSTWLVKPYVQYLCKLCLLNMPDETTKNDFHTPRNLFLTPSQTQNQQKPQQLQYLNSKLIDWYRKFNFVAVTLDTFGKILAQTDGFFNASFPFLNNIGKLMTTDLNLWILKLKYNYRHLKQSNVTTSQFNQIQSKITTFSKQHTDFFQIYLQNQRESQKQVQSGSKYDLSDFQIISPLKHRQLKLFSKKSLDSPLIKFLQY